jgi:hypothetical protein
MRTPVLLGLGLLLAATASAQQPQLRARELFYTPITEAKPAATSTKDANPKAASVKPAKPKPGRQTREDADAAVQAANKVGNSTEGLHLQNASVRVEEVAGPPLALKYRILKRTEEARYDEVDTDTIFHSGDKIRVSVESNDDGYLYIVQQGSSKTWNLLFPSDDIENGSNHIQRNREYDLPSGGRFAFDEQPGEERLFIVLARRPEPDLEKLIYSLSQDGLAKPATGSQADQKPKMMIAQSKIEPAVIDRLRGMTLARDLVFEKVNDDVPVSISSGFRKEKAMYVASPDRTSKARVVVDLTLKHE